MSKKSTTKIVDDAPVTQADINCGWLVLRKRGADGTMLPAKCRINIFSRTAENNSADHSGWKFSQIWFQIGKLFKL
jgi:hypothetical protein